MLDRVDDQLGARADAHPTAASNTAWNALLHCRTKACLGTNPVVRIREPDVSDEVVLKGHDAPRRLQPLRALFALEQQSQIRKRSVPSSRPSSAIAFHVHAQSGPPRLALGNAKRAFPNTDHVNVGIAPLHTNGVPHRSQEALEPPDGRHERLQAHRFHMAPPRASVRPAPYRIRMRSSSTTQSLPTNSSSVSLGISAVTTASTCALSCRSSLSTTSPTYSAGG